jgi:hypothetical protein
MFNITEILIEDFVGKLRDGYRRTYGGQNPDYEDIIVWAGSMAIENLANSDALYHNIEHTILVTLVGQEILRGKHIREGGVSCDDWLHFIISLVCHDIGYVKGACRADQEASNLFATGIGTELVQLPAGATDAALTSYHVDRGKMFIDDRFANNRLINAHIIKQNIEWTRFPVPHNADNQNVSDYPGLVRAADLIGQLSDPRYLKKISALFFEFEETGLNTVLGYKSPGDLRANYPTFYWNIVHPYVVDGLRFLSVTQEGKQIVSNLYANVFMVENRKK